MKAPSPACGRGQGEGVCKVDGLINRFALRGCFVGGSPTATYFSLLRQSKVSKRKATADLLPSGVPVCAPQKMGNEGNSLRSDSLHF